MREHFKEHSRDLIATATGAQSLRSVVEFHVEPMCEHDLIEVIEIEEVSRLSPWGWDAYHSQLVQGALMLVARAIKTPTTLGLESRVLGYIATHNVIDELHITNIAVRPEFRCYGIASTLLCQTFKLAKHSGIASALLEVRSSNHEARMLYDKLGFQLIGTRYSYYSQPIEDALVMRREIARSDC